MHARGTSFGGVLFTLHAGPRLLAAHFGVRPTALLHWRGSLLVRAFGRPRAGSILLRELIAAAPEMGITRIDLGRGDDEYKRRAKTGETTVAQGLVTRNRARLMLRRTRESLVSTARSSRAGPALRRAVRRFRNR